MEEEPPIKVEDLVDLMEVVEALKVEAVRIMDLVVIIVEGLVTLLKIVEHHGETRIEEAVIKDTATEVAEVCRLVCRRQVIVTMGRKRETGTQTNGGADPDNRFTRELAVL